MRFRRLVSVAGILPVLVFAGTTAQATETNTGGGALLGTVAFAPGMGVPLTGTACAPDSWTFSATTAAVVLDIANDEFVGTLNLSGSGSSACAVGGAETGSLSINATNSTGVGHFSCGVSGGYTRVGTHVHADTFGTCTVNNHTDPAEFIAEGEFVPTHTTGPLTSPVADTATFAGGFVVAPPF